MKFEVRGSGIGGAAVVAGDEFYADIKKVAAQESGGAPVCRTSRRDDGIRHSALT